MTFDRWTCSAPGQSTGRARRRAIALVILQHMGRVELVELESCGMS